MFIATSSSNDPSSEGAKCDSLDHISLLRSYSVILNHWAIDILSLRDYGRSFARQQHTYRALPLTMMDDSSSPEPRFPASGSRFLVSEP